MRWALVPLLVALADCGPSQTDIDKVRAEERARSDEQRTSDLANAARADCEGEQQRLVDRSTSALSQASTDIRNAVGFVSSRTGVSSVAFGVRIENLEGDNWRWEEGEEVTSDYGDRRSDRLRYEVSRSALSPSVAITTINGAPGIRFSCRSGNCIRVIGRRVVNGSLVDLDEMRPDNHWAFDTTNRAEVAQRALTTLINGGYVRRDCSGS